MSPAVNPTEPRVNAMTEAPELLQPADSEPFHLLIVDDVAQNIQIVASMLKFDQYRLSFALSGQVALQLIEQQRFDLILLDIQMPEMDGFAVCQRLKREERTRDIPVIFLTAN